MARLQDDMMSFLSASEIEKLVKRMAKEIQHDYSGKELILICPLKGSVHFVADLMRQLDLNQQVDFVQLSGAGAFGTVRILKDISVNIANKHVLICEEIIDTGRTLSFLKTRLLASNPASLKVAALLDKPARRELPIKPDYVGTTIEDRYVVGYGMDAEELGRNYDGIYYFKQ
jgi:hypoxanthine phosphoribosyltransferase